MGVGGGSAEGRWRRQVRQPRQRPHAAAQGQSRCGWNLHQHRAARRLADWLAGGPPGSSPALQRHHALAPAQDQADFSIVNTADSYAMNNDVASAFPPVTLSSTPQCPLRHTVQYITVLIASHCPAHRSTHYVTLSSTSQCPLRHTVHYITMSITSHCPLYHTTLYIILPSTSLCPLYYSAQCITLLSI